MKTEEKLLRKDLAVFVEKMKQAGYDLKTIKKPTDAGTSIGRF